MSAEELEQLRDQVARLTARLDEIEAADDLPAAEVTSYAMPNSTVTRRHWMKAAAAAAVGGTAAAVAVAQPAAADDPNDLALGSTKSTAGLTQGRYTGSASASAFVFQSGNDFTNSASSSPSALAGWSSNSDQPAGVYGYSDVADDFDAHGVVGSAANNLGSGVFGESFGEGPGVQGEGTTYGVQAAGTVAALNLVPTGIVPPTETTDFHQGGELFVRAASDSGLAVELWYCTVGGTPGSWVQLAGPFLPGGFRAIDPVRAYDSRLPLPTPGRLDGGDKRVVDLSQSRDLNTGVPTGPLVPEGATAVAFNIAVVNTAAGGFLSVVPGATATSFNAATINWSAGGQILNNGSVVRVFSDRTVSVFAGGAGSTQFTIDVTGYWV